MDPEPENKTEIEDLRQNVQRRMEDAEKLEEADIEPMDGGLRAFVAAPAYANSKVLVKAGTIEKAVMGSGALSGIAPLSRRVGDIWARFAGGVLVTDDPDIIRWCESQLEVCQDANDPRTKAWIDWKKGQTKTSSSDAALPADYNITEVLFPEKFGKAPAEAPVQAPEAPRDEISRHPVDIAATNIAEAAGARSEA